MKHQHQWVYTGDLIVTINDSQNHSDAGIRRLEYCVDCGTIRVKFGTRWWSWYSAASRQFLSKFDDKIPTPTKRLGRGLQHLLEKTQPALKLLTGGKHGKG